MARQESDVVATSMEAGASAPGEIVFATNKSSDVDSATGKTDLQNVLSEADASRIDLQKLQEYIELLQAKAQQFEAIRKKQAPSRYQILYRLLQRDFSQHQKKSSKLERQYSLPFFDHPEWVKGQGNASRIQCNLPLHNFELYLEKNKDVAFFVYRNFDTESASIVAKPGTDDTTIGRAVHLPQYTSETIRPVNQDLIEAIKTLLSSRVEYSELLRDYATTNELAAPYLFVYHNRKNLEEFQNSLPLPASVQLSLLSSYVTEQFAEEYKTADSLLSQSKISPKYIRYLFKPGDLLIQRHNSQYQGYVATSWPKISLTKEVSRTQATTLRENIDLPIYGSRDAAARMATDKITVYFCDIKAWHWAFDGNFQRVHTTLLLNIPDTEDEGKHVRESKGKNSVETGGNDRKPESREKSLPDLNVFPIQYASAKIVENFRRRGKTFWKCRNRGYVSYQDNEMESIQNLVSAFEISTDRVNHHSYQRNRQASDTWSISKPTAACMGKTYNPTYRTNLVRKQWLETSHLMISSNSCSLSTSKATIFDGKSGMTFRQTASSM